VASVITRCLKTPIMSCAHRHLSVSRLSFHFIISFSFSLLRLYYYCYVTPRTLLSAPVYGILCTSQGLSRYCILYLCIITLAIEGFGVKPVNIVDAVRSDLLAHLDRDIQSEALVTRSWALSESGVRFLGEFSAQCATAR
jgi:hypothetical protein